MKSPGQSWVSRPARRFWVIFGSYPPEGKVCEGVWRPSVLPSNFVRTLADPDCNDKEYWQSWRAFCLSESPATFGKAELAKSPHNKEEASPYLHAE